MWLWAPSPSGLNRFEFAGVATVEGDPRGAGVALLLLPETDPAGERVGTVISGTGDEHMLP